MAPSRPLFINPAGVDLQRHGGVMSGHLVPYHMPGHTGLLSIKSMVRGEGRWRTDDGEYLVEPGQLLVLPRGQHYSFTITGAQRVRTLCPFFAPALVREACAARSRDLGRLLADGPDTPDPGAPGFVERIRHSTPALERGLARLLAAIDEPDHEWQASDRLIELLDVLLDDLTSEQRHIASLPAARAATREELFRRVSRARDYLHANLARPQSLAHLARVAGMSDYHFHRSFRAVVGTTPARYLSELRLHRARRLLRSRRNSVTDVCYAVGFASLGSFSSAFHRRFGETPSACRQR